MMGQRAGPTPFCSWRKRVQKQRSCSMLLVKSYKTSHRIRKEDRHGGWREKGTAREKGRGEAYRKEEIE